MGQKIHPTSFRTCVNKSYNSSWFAKPRKYSQVLQEDYRVREFLREKFHSNYSKSGIINLEIRKSRNAFILRIYAAKPDAIDPGKDKATLIKELETQLETYVTSTPFIFVKILTVIRSGNESSLVARSISDQLEKRVAFRKAVRKATQQLQKSGVKGFKIQVAGRLNGAEIARTEWIREGRVPLQTLKADISYATQRANTIYGVIGIKVWIFKKEII